MINSLFQSQLYSDSFQHAPIADKKRPGSPLSVLEVEDPKQCVLAHFMTPLEPLDPLVESPVSRPLVLQRDTAAELVAEIAPSASQSILLTNMEKDGNLTIDDRSGLILPLSYDFLFNLLGQLVALYRVEKYRKRRRYLYLAIFNLNSNSVRSRFDIVRQGVKFRGICVCN